MIRFLRPFDPHRIRLLVFDLDGTLIDSRLDLIHSVNAMLQHIGRPALDGDVIASYVGDGAPALVRRAIGDTDDEALFRAAMEYFLGYYRIHKLDHTTVYAGIAETLANLVAVVVYATDMPALMATADIFAKRFGDAPPSSTWLGTTALAHPDQLVEITATAVDVNGY